MNNGLEHSQLIVSAFYARSAASCWIWIYFLLYFGLIFNKYFQLLFFCGSSTRLNDIIGNGPYYYRIWLFIGTRRHRRRAHSVVPWCWSNSSTEISSVAQRGYNTLCWGALVWSSKAVKPVPKFFFRRSSRRRRLLLFSMSLCLSQLFQIFLQTLELFPICIPGIS